MNIQANKIIFPTHVVVCDPACASAEYLQDMAEHIKEYAENDTPREHARVLRNCNNDGTWGIKVYKGYQPCAIIAATQGA